MGLVNCPFISINDTKEGSLMKQIYNKKGMYWSNFIVGFILFSAVMFAGLMPISELINAHDLDGGVFNTSFTKISQLSNITGDLSNTVQEGTIEESDIFTTQVRNAQTAVKLLFGMPAILFSLLGEFGSIFGLPYWVLPIVALIITISLVFLLLGYWFKKSGEDN